MSKTLFILIGPKGSGKTHIGTLVQQELGIVFIRIEDLWVKLKEERFSNEYLRKGFSQVEKEINNKFKETNTLIVESTAASTEFHNLLSRLKANYEVKLIQIIAPLDLCLERIKKRDQSIHIAVSEAQIEEINRISSSADLPFDLTIKNDKTTDDEIIKKFSSLI